MMNKFVSDNMHINVNYCRTCLCFDNKNTQFVVIAEEIKWWCERSWRTRIWNKDKKIPIHEEDLSIFSLLGGEKEVKELKSENKDRKFYIHEEDHYFVSFVHRTFIFPLKKGIYINLEFSSKSCHLMLWKRSTYWPCTKH